MTESSKQSSPCLDFPPDPKLSEPFTEFIRLLYSTNGQGYVYPLIDYAETQLHIGSEYINLFLKYLVENGFVQNLLEICCPHCDADVGLISVQEELSEDRQQCDVCDKLFIPTGLDLWAFYKIAERFQEDFGSFLLDLPPSPKIEGGERSDLFGLLTKYPDALVGVNAGILQRIISGRGGSGAFNISKFRELLDRSYKIDASNKTEKGEVLEQLIRILFASVEGLAVEETSVRAQYEEIDIAIRNQNDKLLRVLDDLILGECKNWSAPNA